jgi:outer membrane protein insertion porin family
LEKQANNFNIITLNIQLDLNKRLPITHFNHIMRIKIIIITLLISLTNISWGQVNDSLPLMAYPDAAKPSEYEIGGIKVEGNQFTDGATIISISGLKVGNKIKIPGLDIPRAVKSLWKLRLFTSIDIIKEKTIGDVIFLIVKLKERPNLSLVQYKGVKKGDHDELNKIVNKFILKGTIITESNKNNAANGIEKYYNDKGFLDATVVADEQKDDKRTNSVKLVFNIEKKSKVKIQSITFDGNTKVTDKKLRQQMDKTHRKAKLFASSKLVKEAYDNDKQLIIKYYNKLGYRDAKITRDSLWREQDGDLMISMGIEEGPQYKFRNIVWKGNTIYDDQVLSTILGINKGDIYNQELLESKLRFSQDNRDVSSLYMDNGYLFFNVDPTEVSIDGDSIDLELRIYEGPQATIDKVVIKGNDRTHEHVIRRELRTLPGEKFSRSDIIRSQREIINLGFFDPEALGINTPVNPQRGTVDIEYKVAEKQSDQLELSAGWGFNGVIGTLGLSFNNFSLRNIFKKEAWSPLPQGDGQRLSIRAQTNGQFFKSYNFSFTEPWLGGKKPTSLNVGFAYTEQSYTQNSKFSIINANASIGTRLKFPDDNFIFNLALDFQKFGLVNSPLFNLPDNTRLSNGDYYQFTIQPSITRSSISDPLFPTSGSKVQLLTFFTPPYSLFRSDSSLTGDPQTKYKYIEYFKWRLNTEWYTTIVGKLVLKTEAKIGSLGYYSKKYGLSPFSKFQVGGDGLANRQQFGLQGFDQIALRGYDIGDIRESNNGGGGSFAKYTIEFRYPISTNPNSTIYLSAFAVGGNAWRSFKEFNPLDVRRTVGFGARVFLPMFGVLGLDWGVGLDKPLIDAKPGRKWSEFGRLAIILGFEPD